MEFIGMITLALACLAQVEEARTWTDTKGRTLQGELVRVSGENVVLKINGAEKTIPLSVLSEGDRAFIAKASPAAPMPKPAQPVFQVTTQTDQDLIRGAWICERHWEDGIEIPNPSDLRAVFLEKECKIGGEQQGMSYYFKLDPKQNPKQCDFKDTFGAGFDFPAIYEIKGDTLKISRQLSFGSSMPAVAPKDFKPAENVSVAIYRRAAKWLEENPKRAAKPLEPEAEAGLQSLRKDVAALRKLLEEEKYEEFARKLFPPSAIDRELAEGERRKDSMERMKNTRGSWIKLLKALETETPVLNFAGSKAVFDLRLIHFEGLNPINRLALEKTGGKWHVAEESGRR